MRLENLSLIDAFYYNIVTMSTVGYGDIHPTQVSTRLLAVFIIILGGGTFIGFIANATEMLLMQRDIKRVYISLVEEWLRYLIHLKKHYPYLFSLAARKNPFNPEASVIFPGIT